MNRRGLLGAATLVALGTKAPVAGAEPLATDLRPDVIRHGRAVGADARHVVVLYARRREIAIHDRRTHHKRTLALDGQPLEVAVAHGHAAITTAFWDQPGLALVDLRTGQLRRLHTGPAPYAPRFVGPRLVVSGGEQDGVLSVFDALHYATARRFAIGRVPRGMAAHGRHAVWVALNGEDAVVLVDVRDGRQLRRIATGPQPDRIAASPHGRLLVTHGGVSAHTVTEIDIHSGRARELRVGAHPHAVGYRGRTRLITLDQAVLVGHRRHHPVTTPRGLAVVGRHAFVVSGADGKLGRL